jgi:hypothetical protein
MIPLARPIGTLTEPAAEQQSVKVARGAVVNLSCIWHEDSLAWQESERYPASSRVTL